ncbi:uracil phosphoribosyltransferase-domain-containing protein [Talaromyces proteolyticus]|uniref:uracil phosphoribosyltransferase n=1 Tax=Talaromyces proteolyticus TaxID=1131652 RepID=A0AAD4PVD9_9EURO|nr:uracil phosphoribosyltransferase-domain-containing protein [Talaromyces proteolyticus]KAH8693209.1 uracil phosphoribosyltransferase-domain-containing protein [Talaromyces proteolyticus]
MHNPNGYASDRVVVLEQSNYLLSCMTILRNSETTSSAFYEAFENVANQIIAVALNLIPTEPFTVYTPTRLPYNGRRQVKSICGVSILRAGASFENVLRKSYRHNLSMGTILIQRDEETCLPVYIYSKLPKDIASKSILILEPMLATGGSASKAIEVLKGMDVPEEEIIFVNLVASRKGLDTIVQRFPQLRLVTAAVDEDLTASNHIAPGLGDFGDRFYGSL